MSLITKEVEVRLNSNNVRYLESLGYEIPRRKNINGRMQYIQGTKIIVEVKDLNKNNVLVDVQCDNKECNKILENIKLNDYKRYLRDDGNYYCNTCAKKLYSSENTRKTKLKNSISFKQWCINNNRLDELNRWDHILNNCKPENISFSTTKRYYFKCPRGLHESELKKISNLTRKGFYNINCKQCNSFAQWGIDNLGEDFLNKYWDYHKNTVDPWVISSGNSTNKVWIICQENNYHNSYNITCNSFTGNNSRCPICNESKGEKQLDYILYKYNLPHDSQYTFDDLRGNGNGLLKFDSSVFLDKDKTQLRMLIEYDGKQHYEWIKGMMTKKEFETLQIHDKLKNQYCEKHNIKLLRIPYWDFNNIEEILLKHILLSN